jgi:hypothetical protein
MRFNSIKRRRTARRDEDSDQQHWLATACLAGAVGTVALGGFLLGAFGEYVRQARQYLRAAVEGFDERKYGFASADALLRAAAKDGVLRMDRDRRGAPRFFAGAKLTAAAAPSVEVIEPSVETVADAVVDALVTGEPAPEPRIVDSDLVEQPAGGAIDPEPSKPTARKRKAGATKRATRAAKPRARKTTKTKAEAADRD